MVSQNYVGREVKIQFNIFDYSKLGCNSVVNAFGIIKSVDELGFIITINQCSSLFYKEGETYFISHSTPLSMRFTDE